MRYKLVIANANYEVIEEKEFDDYKTAQDSFDKSEAERVMLLERTGGEDYRNIDEKENLQD